MARTRTTTKQAKNLERGDMLVIGETISGHPQVTAVVEVSKFGRGQLRVQTAAGALLYRRGAHVTVVI